MRLGKSLFLLGILLVLVVITIMNVNSAEVVSCPDSQTIMKLSSESNAHGALWDDETYPISICYNDIFGTDYLGATPHRCDGSNLLVYLNTDGNAHSSRTNIESGYTKTICYGDLTCVYQIIPCEEAPGNYKEVISLSAVYGNAHLASWDSDKKYFGSICCTSGTTTPPVGCLPETTLCDDGVCREDCGVDFVCNNNATCDTGEGCECSDCYGQRDSCINGAVCNNETPNTQVCECAEETHYNSVTGTCVDDEDLCIPGSTLCPNGLCLDYCGEDDPVGCLGGVANLSCDPGEGCACPDCYGRQDHCIVGAVCDGDSQLCECADETQHYNITLERCVGDDEEGCGIGQTLCDDGICRESCDGDFLCDNDATCETGEGCECADCHGEQDSCLTGLVCDFRTDTCQECPLGTEFDSETRLCLPDSGISIRIINPNPNWPFEKFAKNQPVGFNQTSSNLRKDLSINWSFGDESSIVSILNCLTTGNCNTTHSYTHYGLKTITATAYEQGGLSQAHNYTDVLIYESGINVFAIITNPRHDQVIPTGEAVYFNANRSFVANCSITNDACLNSTLTEGGNECYQVGVGGATRVYCYDFNISKIGKTYDLRFNWTFDKTESYNSTLIGTWNDSYRTSIEFNKSFFYGGNHSAELTVTYGYY